MEGKVIRILNDTELLINLGSNDDVRYDQHFEIYEPGEEVRDPLTNKSLGTLDYVKANVEATEVHEAFSVVSHITTSTETVSKGGLAAFAQSSRKITTQHVHPLPVDTDQINPRNVKNESIQIGDPVRSV
uniref:hypothetical protein n=1 Tax=Lentilactobacillus hilgardii TaxID=1588 RepID=UPI00403F6243